MINVCFLVCAINFCFRLFHSLTRKAGEAHFYVFNLKNSRGGVCLSLKRPRAPSPHLEPAPYIGAKETRVHEIL